MQPFCAQFTNLLRYFLRVLVSRPLNIFISVRHAPCCCCSDRLLLLQRGEMIYFGDIGKDACLLREYFARHGAICAPDANPAELYVPTGFSNHLIAHFLQYTRSHWRRHNTQNRLSWLASYLVRESRIRAGKTRDWSSQNRSYNCTKPCPSCNTENMFVSSASVLACFVELRLLQMLPRFSIKSNRSQQEVWWRYGDLQIISGHFWWSMFL